VHRLIELRLGAPVSAIVTVDLLVFATVLAVMGMAVQRALLALAAIPLAGMAVALLLPARATMAFGLSLILVLIGLAIIWGRR
jgi:hypothetical protein